MKEEVEDQLEEKCIDTKDYKATLTPEELKKFNDDVMGLVFRQTIYNLFTNRIRSGSAIIVYFPPKEEEDKDV